MMELLLIALFIGGAFIIQQLLGFIQIKHFTKEYVELRRKGKVAIGRKPGKFRAGTIVLFSISNSGKILEAKKMQGVTILAKVKKLDGFEGKFLKHLKEEDLSHCNKLLKLAIHDAINNYNIIMSGGTIAEKPSPLRSMMLNAERLVSAKK